MEHQGGLGSVLGGEKIAQVFEVFVSLTQAGYFGREFSQRRLVGSCRESPMASFLCFTLLHDVREARKAPAARADGKTVRPTVVNEVARGCTAC